jgi:hypothetical protein
MNVNSKRGNYETRNMDTNAHLCFMDISSYLPTSLLHGHIGWATRTTTKRMHTYVSNLFKIGCKQEARDRIMTKMFPAWVTSNKSNK